MEEWSCPSGQDPKDERRQVKKVDWVLPDREEIVRESVDKDAMQVKDHGREPVTKGTVETRTDFSGRATGGVKRAGSQERYARGQGAGME